MKILVELVDHIDVVKATNALHATEAGGSSIFVGTVRNQANGKEVVKLIFEAYAAMALKEMNAIATRARQKWALEGLVIQHALGEKLVGDAVVVVGASSAHRAGAFEACRFLIDELKKSLPIWKKEYYKDSSVWVNAHP